MMYFTCNCILVRYSFEVKMMSAQKGSMGGFKG